MDLEAAEWNIEYVTAFDESNSLSVWNPPPSPRTRGQAYIKQALLIDRTVERLYWIHQL